MRLSKWPGFVLLSLFSMILMGMSAWNILAVSPALIIVYGLFVAGAVYTMVRIGRDEVISTGVTHVSKMGLADGLAVFAGSALTYAMHDNTPLNVVLATGLVGMIAALFFKRFQVPIYCGAFVGMSSPLLLSWGPFLLATLLAAVVFVLVKDLYNGFGGKLGTIAFSAAFIMSVTVRTPFLIGIRFERSEAFWIIGVSILAATATYVMNILFKQGPVLASAWVGLYLGALLPFLSIMPQTLPIVAIGASFIGMSASARLPHVRGIMVAGVMFGLLFVFSAPYFNGAGGKLGTMAFISTLSVYGLNAGRHACRLKNRVHLTF